MVAMLVCAKRSYATRVLAERDARTHGSWEPSCAKCADGLAFAVYRCPDGTGHVWHLGHRIPPPREDIPVMASTIDRPTATTAPLHGGDLWAAVSTKGRGQPVEIKRVSTSHVYFRATGRGADPSQQFKLPHDAFRVRYAPLKLVAERQRELARAERDGLPSPLVPVPEPVAEDAPADPIAEAIEAVQAEAAAPAPTPDVVPLVQPHKTPTPPKLTGEQAREVFLLDRDGTPAREILATYGIDHAMLARIRKGITYSWATADLRIPAPEPLREEPRRHGGTPRASNLDRDTVRDAWLRKQRGESMVDIGAALGLTRQNVYDIWRGKSYPAYTADLRAARDSFVASAPAATPLVEQEAAPVQNTTPPVMVNPKPVQSSPLVADLADAVDTLLLMAEGRPLPRFYRLDLDAIRALVAEARGQAS